MNQGNLRKITYATIIIFNLLFIVFLITVSFNVRPCSDELAFIYNFTKNGWFGSLMAFNYNVRWTSFLVFNTICLSAKSFQVIHYSYFMYYIITFALLFIALMRFNKLFLKTSLQFKVSLQNNFILSGLILAALYFTTTNAIEVWFWTIASTVYLFPLIFILIGSAELLKSNTNRSFIIIAVCFFLIGGTAENIILVLLVLLTFIILYLYIKNRVFEKKYIIAFLFLSILPIINFFGEGVSSRVELEAANQIYHNIANSLFTDHSQIIAPSRLFLFIMILISLFFLGNMFKNSICISKLNLKKSILLNICALLIVTTFSYLPLIIIFGNLGPARASAPVNFFICFSLCFWAFIAGTKLSNKNILYPAFAGSFLLLSSFSYLSFNQFLITSKFAKAYDQRTNYIYSRKSCESNYIFAPPLPDSGVIAAQEVSDINDDKYGMTSLNLGKVVGVEKKVFLEIE